MVKEIFHSIICLEELPNLHATLKMAPITVHSWISIFKRDDLLSTTRGKAGRFARRNEFSGMWKKWRKKKRKGLFSRVGETN